MEECFETANALSGEPFDIETKVTRLSGGQARALMIADAAFISPSPILLIDEIENAGIDRIKALDLLTKENRIVFLATHDPLLALSASKRIVLNNGAIASMKIPNDDEKEILSMLKAQDIINTKLKNDLRKGIKLYVGNV
jgi:ABC-type lipoprotein export system ATPase subunit